MHDITCILIISHKVLHKIYQGHLIRLILCQPLSCNERICNERQKRLQIGFFQTKHLFLMKLSNSHKLFVTINLF